MSEDMPPVNESESVRWNPTKSAVIVGLAMTVSTIIWGAATTNERISANAMAAKERMDVFELKQRTLEEKIEWQNKKIWEMSTDIRVLVIRSGGTPTTQQD